MSVSKAGVRAPIVHWPLRVFATIDAEARAERRAVDGRPAVALLLAAFCLLALHYLKFHGSFQEVLAWFSEQFYGQPRELRRQLAASGFLALAGELWWGGWHLLAYFFVPALVIRYGFRERLGDYGLRWGRTTAYLPWYAALTLPIVFFAFLASFRPDFAAHYPFYDLAHRSWFDLLAWECIYIVQFIALEFFFRGFLLHACKPAFGSHAILVMVLPYTMLHFPKPWLEAAGAIFFGLFLGILALRSRSIWGGALTHVCVAVSMDLLALIQTGRLPKAWWP